MSWTTTTIQQQQISKIKRGSKFVHKYFLLLHTNNIDGLFEVAPTTTVFRDKCFWLFLVKKKERNYLFNKRKEEERHRRTAKETVLLEHNCGQEVSAERLAMTRQAHETKSQHASHARTLGPYWTLWVLIMPSPSPLIQHNKT